MTALQQLLLYGLLPLTVLLLLLERGRIASLRDRVEDLERELRRRCETLNEELEESLSRQRQLLSRVAAGEAVEPAMIEEGRLWRDLSPEEGRALFESGEDVLLVDVRTPAEQLGGVIPNAMLLPLDQLEARAAEIPKTPGKKLIYCAGGGRSAAACEFLSGQGVGGLHNLAGGISAWTGPTEAPPS